MTHTAKVHSSTSGSSPSHVIQVATKDMFNHGSKILLLSIGIESLVYLMVGLFPWASICLFVSKYLYIIRGPYLPSTQGKTINFLRLLRAYAIIMQPDSASYARTSVTIGIV